MMLGLHVRRIRYALVPCPLLLLLVGCTPPAAGPSLPLEAAASLGGDVYSGPMGSGRFYALGQVLAREQQRAAALQQQLEQRGKEIDQLRTEVQQLHEHETELRAALERATGEHGEAASAPAAVAAVGPTPGAPTGASAPRPPAGEEAAVARPGDGHAEEALRTTVIASLRTALFQEQQRRQEAETELGRLKEETARPPYAESGPTEADLAAAKQQVSELRTALEDERTARARLAQELTALQRRAAQEAANPPTVNPENAELRARLESLQAERQAAMDSFNRTLASSQKRAADLEQELAVARANAAAAPPAAPASAGTTDPAAATVQVENAALRARLDEEHRRTQELTAKLKLATRVTDLIFKIQTQESQGQPAQPR
jgi:chromosome segregation ATPase